MDRSIHDTEKLQTNRSSSSNDIFFSPNFDTFDTSLDLPRRVLPMYAPGDVVTGHVVVRLKKPLKAEAVTVNFLGEAISNVKTYDKYAYFDESHRETYANDHCVLWQRTGLDIAGKDDKPETGEMIPAGDHRFPFTFTIPMETSQSTPNLLPSCQRSCYVVYRLKAMIATESVEEEGQGDIVTHKGLWVEKPFDIAEDPDNLVPFTDEETLDTGVIFKSGSISIKATLPRRGFVRGEEIPLTLEIDNQTLGDIDRVSACIAMHGVFRYFPTKLSATRSIKICSAKKQIRNVSETSQTILDWKLAWDFTGASVDGNLLPTGTLDDCKLIDVKYDVLVKVKRAGMHRNMHLEIPLVIGNKNSKE